MLVIEYSTPSTGKIYHHKMPLGTVTADSLSTEIVMELTAVHHQYLSPRHVSYDQLDALVEKVISSMPLAAVDVEVGDLINKSAPSARCAHKQLASSNRTSFPLIRSRSGKRERSKILMLNQVIFFSGTTQDRIFMSSWYYVHLIFTCILLHRSVGRVERWR